MVIKPEKWVVKAEAFQENIHGSGFKSAITLYPHSFIFSHVTFLVASCS